MKLIQIFGRELRHLIAALAVLYTLLYLLWRLLLLTPAYDRFWQLQVSEIFGSWLYFPLIPLIFLTLALHRPKMILLLLIPFFFFSYEYGRQFLPNWHLLSQDMEQGIPVRVMSWNMLYGTDRNGEFQAEVEALAPDIIVLQELNYRMDRLLPEAFSSAFPHQQIFSAGRSASLAILSRYPFIQQDEDYDMSRACVCLKVVVDIKGRPVTVVNMHSWSPDITYTPSYERFGIRKFSLNNQNMAFDAVMARVGSVNGPLLIAGDLNTTERQPNYWRIRHTLGLEDSFAEAGWGMGYTFPNEGRFRKIPIFPFIRIDHILHSEEWVAKAAWTGKIETSDHRYVVADLLLMEIKK